MKTIIAMSLAFLAVAPAISGQAEREQAMPGIHLPTEPNWKEGPAALPAGAKVALLEGDPAREGPFTLRLLFPDGYRIPPHTHPKVEHVTVISGIFHLGMGEKFDQSSGHSMPAGSFGFWPAGMKHFAWTTGETIIQLHGVGPWAIHYLNPADDPRNTRR
ncbi:MAG: cupin domain-containing protein [Verrucomicrobiota bacterium]